LLFEPGAMSPDQDLCVRSEHQLETYVQLGEPIGRRVTGGHS